MTLSEAILADGPIAYYELTEDLLDSSGNGNHLTIHQAGTTEFGHYTPFGQSGTRGTAVYDTGVTPSGDWSIEFVVERKDPVSGPEPYAVVSDGTAATGVGAWASLGSTGYLQWTDSGTTYFGYEGDGTAFHFIAVSSGGTLSVYRGASVMGGSSASFTTSTFAAPTPSGSTLKIGNAGGAMYAHVAYFDFALSEFEVQAHMSGAVVGPEVEPTGDAMDSYPVAGALSASTPLYGFGWSTTTGSGGSGAIVAGEYVTNEGEFTAFNSLIFYNPPPDPATCIDIPTSLSMDVELPAGFDMSGAYVALGFTDNSTPGIFGAVVYGSNLVIAYTDGSAIVGLGSTAIDVTAGTHSCTLWFDGVYATAWWDGVAVGNGPLSDIDATIDAFLAVYADDPCSIAPGFALYGNAANDTYTFSPLTFLIGSGEYGGLDAPDLDGGLVRMRGIDNNLYVGGLEAPELTGGTQAPILPDLLRDVPVGGLNSPPLTGGLLYSYSPTTFPPALPVTTPDYQYGPPSGLITIPGYTNRKSASFNAAMNSAGSGQFEVLPPGPSAGAEVAVAIGGRTVFTGYADTSAHEVAPGEEDEQTVSVNLTDILEVDWTETVVWPDIAASEPIRLGRPPQSDRTWDWHSNSAVLDRTELVPSVEGNNDLYGTAQENHPYPDNWPDPYSKWMWDRIPDRDNIPAGWVYFRVPFGLLFAKEVGIFLCAWDYATLSIDGQQFIEADQPGATFRHDLHLDWDYHLVTIAAYTEGGKAGVNCSIMPKEKHGFTPSVMNSRGGWQVLSYPEKPLRFTVGRVLERLVSEASDRGAPAGDWSLAFDKDQDSAGNPWPTDDSLITTSVGMTYWDVLNQLAEDRIDFRASPSGRTLYAYVKGEPPRSVGSPWAAGATLADRYEDQAIR